MKIKVTKSDVFLLFLYFAIGACLSLYGYHENTKWSLILLDTLVYEITTIIGVLTIVYVLFAKYLPSQKYWKLFGSMVFFMIMLGSLINILESLYIDFQNSPLSFRNLYYGFLNVVENVGLPASIIIGKKFFEHQIYFQKMEKEKKENELRVLRSQIDPHFLFNNLNTVDSLIDTDPESAKTYINKLSKLYRYLITTKDEDVVALSDELDFIKNYKYLIEKRFGDAYIFNISYEQGFIDNALIPPGAMQTLVENAVKHNIGSSKSPIITDINISEKNINITNNIQLKKKNIESTGTGIKNLKSRYELLGKKIKIDQSPVRFTATLPLIKEVS